MFYSNPHTISKKLKENYNINTKENSIKNNSKAVIGTNRDGEIIEFSSLSDAARYLMDCGITKNRNVISVISKISISLHKTKKSAYGFKWKYKVA